MGPTLMPFLMLVEGTTRVWHPGTNKLDRKKKLEHSAGEIMVRNLSDIDDLLADTSLRQEDEFRKA